MRDAEDGGERPRDELNFGRSETSPPCSRKGGSLAASTARYLIMSLVPCTKHGRQTGPHCCRHVLDAACQKKDGTDLRSLARFKIDSPDNGKDYLHFILCESCGTQYGLCQRPILPSEFFAEDRLPWTAPICSPCFEALETKLIGLAWMATDLSDRRSWSGRRDLNSGPLAPHASALPGCATSRRNFFHRQCAGGETRAGRQ
jgi:hypothetical protein